MVRAPRRARPRPPAPAEAIGGDGNGGRTSWHRLERSMLAGRADHAQPTGPTRAASLEVFVPSAHAGRAALSGVADPRTIPLRRFTSVHPRDGRCWTGRSAPAVLRFGGRKSESLVRWRTCGKSLASGRAPQARRLQWATSIPSSLASDAGVTLLVTRSIAHPTNQAAPARVCRPGWVMRRCAFSHGVPLPTTFRALAAWSSGCFFPHPLDGAHGVAALRRFAPARG